jgi:hypothetical protein
LKAAEEKMNESLLSYTEGNRQDSSVRQILIEDLKRATTEFLELRKRAVWEVKGTEID